MTAAEALANAHVRREIAFKAHVDDRTVKRVLRGVGPHNWPWERIRDIMTTIGIEEPPSPRLASVPPAKEEAR